jgi:hypothetical protein
MTGSTRLGHVFARPKKENIICFATFACPISAVSMLAKMAVTNMCKTNNI